MADLGVHIQLMVLAKATSLHQWTLQATSNKALHTVRCSVAPDEKDIWTLSEWTNYPTHVYREHDTAQALQALRDIPNKDWRRKIISSLPSNAELLELAAAAAKTFTCHWVRGAKGGGVLHQTSNAAEFGSWLFAAGLSVRDIALHRDFCGRNALHIAAQDNRVADIEYLIQLEPKLAQQCDALGSNPTALASGEARELLCRWAKPIEGRQASSSAPADYSRHAQKVVILGDGADDGRSGVGKTSFTKKYKTGLFEQRYVPTLGVEVTGPLLLHTNNGKVAFNTWDVAGQERYGGLRDGYLIGAQAAIIMFDLTESTSIEHVQDWLEAFRRIAGPDAPVIVCGNKADMEGSQILNQLTRLNVETVWKDITRYCEISVQTGYQIQLPFLHLAQKLLGEDTVLVEAPPGEADSAQEQSQPVTSGTMFGATPPVPFSFQADFNQALSTPAGSFCAPPVSSGPFAFQADINQLASTHAPGLSATGLSGSCEGIRGAFADLLLEQLQDEQARVMELEQEVASLKQEVASLKARPCPMCNKSD